MFEYANGQRFRVKRRPQDHLSRGGDKLVLELVFWSRQSWFGIWRRLSFDALQWRSCNGFRWQSSNNNVLMTISMIQGSLRQYQLFVGSNSQSHLNLIVNANWQLNNKPLWRDHRQFEESFMLKTKREAPIFPWHFAQSIQIKHQHIKSPGKELQSCLTALIMNQAMGLNRKCSKNVKLNQTFVSSSWNGDEDTEYNDKSPSPLWTKEERERRWWMVSHPSVVDCM